MLKLRNKIMRINTNRKQFFSLILIFSLLLTFAAGVGGSADVGSNISEIDELNKKAEQITKDINEKQSILFELMNNVENQALFVEEVHAQVAQIEAQAQAYIELINIKQSSIDELGKEIKSKETEITNTVFRIDNRELEVAQLKAETEENIEKFGEISAQLYMTSGGDIVSLLTGSMSFYDVLVRTEMIKNIGEKNVEIIEALVNSIERHDEAVAQLEEDVAGLQIQKAELEERQIVFLYEMEQLQNERAVVSEKVENQYKTLHSLIAERDDLQNIVNSLNEQISSSNDEISDIKKRVAELKAMDNKIEEELHNHQTQNPEAPQHSPSGFVPPLSPQFMNIVCDFMCESGGVLCHVCVSNGSGLVGRVHNGVDLSGSGISGANIFAVQSGTVFQASMGWNGGFGNFVIIDHGGGYSTVYAHMNSISVSEGQAVTQGQVIGTVGNTGFSFGAHLHFEVRKYGTAVNPINYL
jgi:murein DD-endopeptidase MepM/ murein hydrolase activator NlpD